ncbi:MAG: Hsp70 family protein [Pseudonocardia sp.]
MTEPRPQIVGFDLGHAETALATVRDPNSMDVSRLELPSARGRPMMVTAIAECPDGVRIGYPAVDTPHAVSRAIGFKSSQLNLEAVSRAIRLFVGAVREELRTEGALHGDRPIWWVFGVPSGWGDIILANYRKLLLQAGLEDVEVVRESRAAMLYARDSGEFSIDTVALFWSVLVVDLGSSTADFTIVTGLMAKPADVGSRLGAGLIDRAVMQWLLRCHPRAGELMNWLNSSPETEWARLELVCRWAKEDYFRNEAAPETDEHIFGSGFYRPVAGDGQVIFDVTITREVMADVLAQALIDDNTWPEQLRQDMTAAAAVIDGQPSLVLMTGGASRMPFARDIARELFGADRVVIGTEPELAIARGLALAGRIGFRASGFRVDVAELLESGQVETMVRTSLPVLGDEIGHVVADGFFAKFVLPAMARFKRGEITTLAALENEIGQSVKANLSDDHPGIRAAVASWQLALCLELRQLTDPICDRWWLSRSALSLDGVSMDGDGVEPAVPVSGQLTGTAGGAAAVVAGVVTWIAGIVVASMLVTGPIGATVASVMALFAAVAAAVMGREAAMDTLRHSELPQWVRRLLREEKLRRTAPQREKELQADLAKQIVDTGGDTLVGDVARRLERLLKNQAAAAELLIS